MIFSTFPLIDYLFEDVKTLASNRDTAADHDDLWVLGELPPQFANHYNGLFARKFLIATAGLTGRLTQSGWDPPRCVAEELALRLLIEQAQANLEGFGLATWEESEQAYDWFRDCAFEDLDHEGLFEPALDGFEDDPSYHPLGMAPMGFESWFVPFRADEPIHPYAEGLSQGEAGAGGSD